MVLNRLIPEPSGFDDDVKTKAARAERAWEAVTGGFTFFGAGGTAAVAAGVAIPPFAPFLAAVAAGSFYFKLRAKWAREDPPRPDFDTPTSFNRPTLDLMVLLPGSIPQGASIVSLLHAAGASVEATVVAAERAMGATLAEWQPENKDARTHAVLRMSEARQHADRTKLLTRSLHVAALDFVPFIEGQTQQGRTGRRRLVDLLDADVLGRLIAAGVDPALLEEEVPDSPVPPKPWRDLFSEAGDAAEQLGAALAAWGHAASFRPSP